MASEDSSDSAPCVWIQANEIRKRIKIKSGLDKKQLAATIRNALNIPDTQPIQQVFVPDLNCFCDIEHVCSHPMVFSHFKNIQVATRENMETKLGSAFAPQNSMSETDVERGPNQIAVEELVERFVSNTRQRKEMRHEEFRQTFADFIRFFQLQCSATCAPIGKILDYFDSSQKGLIELRQFVCLLALVDGLSSNMNLQSGLDSDKEIAARKVHVFNIFCSHAVILERYSISVDDLLEMVLHMSDIGILCLNNSGESLSESNDASSPLSSCFKKLSGHLALFDFLTPFRLSLDQLHEDLGLARLDCQEAVSKLIARSRNSCFDYYDVISEALSTLQDHSKPKVLTKTTFEDIIGLFIVEETRFVDCIDLASALSLLLPNPLESKAQTVICLLSNNSHGYITAFSLRKYFRAVYSFALWAAALQCPKEERIEYMVEMTTRQALLEKDFDCDGRLFDHEFVDWLKMPNQVSHDFLSSRKIERELTLQLPLSYLSLGENGIHMDKICSLTGLDKVDFPTVFEIFAKRVDSTGNLSWPAFLKSFESVFQSALVEEICIKDSEFYCYVLRRLFLRFRSTASQSIDLMTFGPALLLLCNDGHFQTNSFRAVLSLIQIENDQSLSASDLSNLLQSIYLLLYEVSASPIVMSGDFDVIKLSNLMTFQCFASFDLNIVDTITFEQFWSWFYLHNQFESDSDSSLSMKSLDIVRRTGESIRGFVAEVQGVTGLGNFETEEIIENLKRYVEPDTQVLASDSFVNFVMSTKPLSVDLERSVDLLFALYNRVSECLDSRVLLQDITCALSIFFAGDRDENAELVFQILSGNLEGAVSFDCVKRYFLSVLSIAFCLDPLLRLRMGLLNANELSNIVAAGIFESLGESHEGKIIYEEFYDWYILVSPAAIDDTSKFNAIQPTESNLFSGNETSVEKLCEYMRQLDMKPQRIADCFFDAANREGVMDFEAFSGACLKLVDELKNFPPQNRASFQSLVKEVFMELADVDTDKVDSRYAFSKLRLYLQYTTSESRSDSAFSFIDLNKDNKVSFEEMTRYLFGVFSIMKHVNEKSEQNHLDVDVNARTLHTCERIFLDMGLNRDDFLSRREFASWYETPSGRQLSVAAVYMAANFGIDWLTTDEIRGLTGIDRYKANDVLERITLAMPKNSVDKANISDLIVPRLVFDQAIEELCGDVFASANDDEFVRLVFVKDRLYDMFDYNGDGNVSLSALSTGLKVLCEDNVPRKMNYTQKELYAENDSDETVYHSTQVKESQSLSEQSGFFSSFDANSDCEERKLSADESEIIELELVASMKSFDAADIRDEIKANANSFNRVSYAALKTILSKISSKVSVEESIASVTTDVWLSSLTDKLFDMFDVDRHESIDATDLTVGLTMICGDELDTKAQIAFSEFDSDQNNLISLNEMRAYLATVFRIMRGTNSPALSQSSFSPSALAKATADQIFIDANLDENGELAFDDFKAWYSGQKLTFIGKQREKPNCRLCFDGVRACTCLGYFYPSDIRQMLYAVSKDDFISRKAFESVFQSNIEFLQNESFLENRVRLEQANTFRESLFNEFTQLDSGIAPTKEIVAGTLFFCGGSMQCRIETVFTLFANNATALLSLEKLSQALLCGIKSMSAVEIGANKLALKLDSAEFANLMAGNVFRDLELDEHDGICLEEFKAWCLKLKYDDFEPYGSLMRNGFLSSSVSQCIDQESGKLDDIGKLMELNRITISQAVDVLYPLCCDFQKADRKQRAQIFARIGCAVPGLSIKKQLAISDRFHDFVGHLKFNDTQRLHSLELFSPFIFFCNARNEEKVDFVFQHYLVNEDVMDSNTFIKFFSAIFCFVSFGVFGDRYESIDLNPLVFAQKVVAGLISQLNILRQNGVSRNKLVTVFSTVETLTYEDIRNFFHAGDLLTKMTLDDLKSLTGLKPKSFEEVFNAFANAADFNGLVSKEAYFGTMAELTGIHFSESRTKVDQTEFATGLLFDSLDPLSKGAIDFFDLSASGSVLCGDSCSEKAHVLFDLLGEYEGNYVESSKLVRFLTSIFCVLKLCRDSSSSFRHMAPKELALSVVDWLFESLGIEHEYLSFDQFKQWLENGLPGISLGDSIFRRDEGISDDGSTVSFPGLHAVHSGQKMEVMDLAANMNWTAAKVLEVIRKHTGNSRDIDLNVFEAIFFELSPPEYLFELFETNADSKRTETYECMRDLLYRDEVGIISAWDVAIGFLLVIDKDLAGHFGFLYNLIKPADGDNIAIDEARRLLRSLFELNCRVYSPILIGKGINESVATSSENINDFMAEIGLDESECVSQNEFRQMFLFVLKRCSLSRLYQDSNHETKADSKKSESSSSTDDENDDYLCRPLQTGPSSEEVTGEVGAFCLRDVRRITGLGGVSPNEIFDEFGKTKNDSGLIDCESFFTVFETVCQKSNEIRSTNDCKFLKSVMTLLYQILKRDSDGMIDYNELCAALFVFCNGTHEERVHLSFTLFDIDKDGFIFVEEMLSLLSVFFRVVFAFVPQTRECVGMEPEDLAQATTEECFSEADTDGDGRLSYEEFSRWFFSGDMGNVIVSGLSSYGVNKTSSKDKSDRIVDVNGMNAYNLGMINPFHASRDFKKLHHISIAEMMEILQQMTVTDEIDFEGFASCYVALIGKAGAFDNYIEQMEISSKMRLLFLKMDQDEDGKIDHNLLASCWTIFCKDTVEMQFRAAFDLVDTDKDGLISYQELRRHLFAIHCVAQIWSCRETTSLEDPEYLGEQAARQCFQKSMVDFNENLTFAAYEAWCKESMQNLE